MEVDQMQGVSHLNSLGGRREVWKHILWSRTWANKGTASKRLYADAYFTCQVLHSRRPKEACNAVGHSAGGGIVVSAAKRHPWGHARFDFIMSLDSPFRTLLFTQPCLGIHGGVPTRVYFVNVWNVLGEWAGSCADVDARLGHISKHGAFWKDRVVSRIAARSICRVRRRVRGWTMSGPCP